MKTLQIIGEIAKRKNISIAQLAKKCDMTTANMYKIMDKNSISTENVEKIAKALEIHPSYFFEDYMIDLVEENKSLIKDFDIYDEKIKSLTTQI